MPDYAHHYKKFEKSNTYELARAAYATSMFLKDQVNIEHKQFTIQPTPQSITNIGSVYNLVGGSFGGIVQGISNGERIGDSIKLQRLVFRGLFIKHTDALATIMRIILFKGKAEASANYTVADVLETVNVFSGKREENRFNTTILYDEVHIVDSVKSQYFEADWNKELDWHCNFDPAAITIADGGLYMLVLSSEATNTPTWQGQMTISYTDD